MKESSVFFTPERQLTDHCGLVGLLIHPDDRGKEGTENPAKLGQEMVWQEANRGQDGFRVVAIPPEGEPVECHRLGREWGELTPEESARLNRGWIWVAQTRYPTAGTKAVEEALQPFIFNGLVFATNGEVFNRERLRAESIRLSAKNNQPFLPLEIDSDSADVFRRILVSEGLEGNYQSSFYDPVAEKIFEALSWARGSFSVVMATNEALYLGRDPWGIRPLCYGKIGEKSFAVASETEALRLIRAREIKPVLPGHFLKITREGIFDIGFLGAEEGEHFCSFEIIYFQHPESEYFVNGKRFKVKEARRYGGRIAARKERQKGWSAKDTAVVPVLRSGFYGAKGYAEESGLPLVLALDRNPEVGQGRIFIQNTSKERQAMVGQKHRLVPELLEGYCRVVVIDDSVVRADTTTAIASMIRQQSPWIKEIHIRPVSPAPRAACRIGIDTHDEELIARRLGGDCEAIAGAIGANSIVYLTREELGESLVSGRKDLLERAGFCVDCFRDDGVRFFPELMEAGGPSQVLINR